MINAQGPDVSKWDGGPSDGLQVIDFAPFSVSNDFCFIKISEWLNKDPLFDRQWAAARGRTVRSAYHFFHAGSDQKREVQKIVDWLGADAGELEASLDMEVSDGRDDVMSQAVVWIDEYHARTGLWPIVYSTRSFLGEHSAGRKTILGAYKYKSLANCKLWLAEWPFDELEAMPGYVERGDALRAVLINEVIDGRRALAWPKPAEPFQQVDFWQWTSRYPPSRIPGYFMGRYHKEAVDMNFSAMSRAGFQAKYPMTPPPAAEAGLTLYGRVSLRAGAQTYEAAGLAFRKVER